MNGGEESDGVVVPMNPVNKATEQQAGAAAREEGRMPTKENTGQSRTPPAQDGQSVSQGLARCASTSKGKQAGTIHHTPAPSDRRTAAGELQGFEEKRGAWSVGACILSDPMSLGRLCDCVASALAKTDPPGPRYRGRQATAGQGVIIPAGGGRLDHS